MICDYLNLAGEFENSFAIINTTKQFKEEKYEIEEGYEQGLEIIANISKHVAYKHDFTKWVGEKNTFASCNPLFKKYLELQVLCIYQKLLSVGKKKDNVKKAIEQLVNDTGFVWFKNFNST